MATTSEHLSRPPYERDLSIDEAFARAASVRPSAIAVAGHYGTLTYDEVERDSNRIANALVARGVKPGDAIGVAFERSMHLPPVLLGILKAGAAYVPLDPSYPHERVAWMIEDAAVSLVVVDGLHELTAIGANCASVAELLACADDVRPGVRSGPESVAYVMYTSG
jgi:non-ribosomal peptide synthetase component F